MTVFLGTRLSKADMSEWAQWVVVGCVGYHCFIEILLAMLKCTSSPSKSNSGIPLEDLYGELGRRQKF